MPALPLSERLRPQDLSELFGQDHLTEEQSFLAQIIKEKKPISMLFWGPPGCGKTTLARIYGQSLPSPFHQLSAVSASTTEIKEILKSASKDPLFRPYTVIFLDEIHRFNKSQQDLFLPYLESGQLILIGATTENPSFSLNNALLSRLRVFTLNSLAQNHLEKILKRYEDQYGDLTLTQEAKDHLIKVCHGDGRYLLNMIENIELYKTDKNLDFKSLKNILQKRSALFDKQGDGHFNLISALHKSIRGSDPDAALYWFARILNGGESPLYVARRLIRCASEDIGLADPQALSFCLDAFKTYQILGSPEGELAIAQAVLYLSLAPKSNAGYTALKAASKTAQDTNHLNPPKHILNAPTKFMKGLGYAQNYQYDHDCPHTFSGQNYFPDLFEKRCHFYQPNEIGYEREMKKRLEYFQKLRQQKT